MLFCTVSTWYAAVSVCQERWSDFFRLWTFCLQKHYALLCSDVCNIFLIYRFTSPVSSQFFFHSNILSTSTFSVIIDVLLSPQHVVHPNADIRCVSLQTLWWSSNFLLSFNSIQPILPLKQLLPSPAPILCNTVCMERRELTALLSKGVFFCIAPIHCKHAHTLYFYLLWRP